MSAPSQFRTANLAAAAYLTAGRHLALLDIDVSDPRRATFVFDDPGELGSGLETGFVSGGALVPGAEFHRQLRALRRLIDERTAESRNRADRERGRAASALNINSEGYDQRASRYFR